MKRIISNPEEMTASWFTSVLSDAGVLGGATVKKVGLESVTGGAFALMVRAELSYEGECEGDAPRSVVVKLPTDDQGSLGLAVAMRMYELECRFYRDVAPLLGGMSIPKCYLAEVGEAGSFVLVLEDLSGRTKAGDVLTPCTTDECGAVLAELVRFQAPLWDSPAVSELAWLSDPAGTLGVFDSLAAGVEPFLARFGDKLDSEHVRLFESTLPLAGRWVRSWAGPTVVQHGDFRSDNLMFGAGQDTAPVTVIDFQTVRLGPPGIDSAYFLGSSLPTEARRASERELITEYHERLVSAGIEGYDFDTCWSQYREGALYGVCLFVGLASQVVSNERIDRVIVDQIRRYADMAVDLESVKAAGLT
jgi:aminoglycoside/choline kinase family phosphotransferase